MNLKKRLLCFGAVAAILCIAFLGVIMEMQEKGKNEIIQNEIIKSGTTGNERKENAKKAMVYMQNGDSGGNGSIYKIEEDELIIVTTYHLLQNAEVIGLRFYDNTYVEGTVLGVNEEHDVGFVTVKKEEIPDATLQKVASIQTEQTTYDSLVQGDPMEYCFLSYDGLFVCQESYYGTIGDMNWYVEDFGDYLIYNYCEVQPGMSGCAAIAEDGSYIGMVIGGYDNESAALSIRVIDKVYQELASFSKS